MSVRVHAALVVLAVLAGSCTPGDTEVRTRPDATTGTSPAAEGPLITTLPEACDGIGPAPRRGQVTFIRDNRLYAATSDGREVRCLARAGEGSHPSWGGLGDRVMLQLSGGISRVLFDDQEARLTSGWRPLSQGLSRPRGLSALFISANRSRLYKIPSNGGSVEDISFLERHDEAVYHPAGEHIAVVGEDRDGTYGIFLATNLGTDPQLLVVGEDAKRIYSLSFSPRGFLYYAAEHEDHNDVHGVSLVPSGEGDVDASRLETYYSTRNTINKVVTSPFQEDGKLAIQVGSGDDGCPSKTILHRRRKMITELDDDASSSTDPIGWLPNGKLVFATLGDDCDLTEGVHVFGRDGSSLLVAGAYAVAVRGVYPSAPDPPNVLPDVVA